MPKQYCLNICYDTLNICSILQRVKKQYQITWSPGMLFPGCAPMWIALRRGQINSKMNRMVIAQNKVTWEDLNFFVGCSVSFLAWDRVPSCIQQTGERIPGIFFGLRNQTKKYLLKNFPRMLKPSTSHANGSKSETITRGSLWHYQSWSLGPCE